MYQVYANNNLIYENGADDLRLTEATLELELGKSGSFVFTIYPDHPHYGAIIQMAPVSVSRNYETIYSGRILGIKYGFYGQKQVTCEGDLAFLLDSMIGPNTYTGNYAGYIDHVLSLHNPKVGADKQFRRGAVTVGDFTPFTVERETEYKSAFDLLNKNMIQHSNGYFQVRNEGGYRYLDLLSPYADASNISDQTIELGKNLLDISRESNGASMFSCIVPLGAKLEGSERRLDITSVNSGIPYLINDIAVELCKGNIYRQVVFENITNAQTLKDEAEKYLSENYAGEYSIEITSADLSGTDASIDFFRVGQRVRVYNEYHFGYAPQIFLIQKMSINLLNATTNKIIVGKVKKGLSDEMATLSNSVESISVPEAVQPYVLESGTTGIWKWAKYSDNTCEFFGKIPVTAYDVNIALGNWYRGANIYEQTDYEYPLQMTEAPALNITFQTRNGLGAMAWVFSATADVAQRYVPQCYLIRPTTATGIYGNINIIARGKLA